MQSRDAMQAARLANLEGAVLALLRAAEDDGFDGLVVVAETDDGEVSFDLNYTAKGVPIAGESL